MSSSVNPGDGLRRFARPIRTLAQYGMLPTTGGATPGRRGWPGSLLDTGVLLEVVEVKLPHLNRAVLTPTPYWTMSRVSSSPSIRTSRCGMRSAKAVAAGAKYGCAEHHMFTRGAGALVQSGLN
jgi:hypothetical protein